MSFPFWMVLMILVIVSINFDDFCESFFCSLAFFSPPTVDDDCKDECVDLKSKET